MTTNNQMQFVKDLPNKKITVTRYFNGTADQVWKAWTEKEMLDQWWAPKPWKTETKTMDFKNGGSWLYAMAGPDGSKHWCISEFEGIHPGESFKAHSTFCDEKGNKSDDLPGMNWKNEFRAENGLTKMTVEITFDKDTEIDKILEMGFEQGFTAALGNLDELMGKRVGRN